MSIGEMIRTDRDASDYYLLEALRSDLRKCEADYDTVIVMEECRRVKVQAVLAKAQVKEVEEERYRERDEAVRFVEARAAEYTEKTLKKQAEFERKISDVRQVLDSEKKARNELLQENARLKKALKQGGDSNGIVEDSDDDSDDDSVDSDGSADDEEEVMEVARVLAGARGASQPKRKGGWKVKKERVQTPPGLRAAKGPKKNAAEVRNTYISAPGRRSGNNYALDSDAMSTDTSESEASDIDSDDEVDASMESNAGRKRKAIVGVEDSFEEQDAPRLKRK